MENIVSGPDVADEQRLVQDEGFAAEAGVGDEVMVMMMMAK